MRQAIQEIQRYGIDLVVHVQTPDILPMLLHDHIDEVIHRRVLVAHQYLAVEHLVVAQDVVEHFLVEVAGWGLEGDFHAAGFLCFEVDVGRVAVEADADGFELGGQEGALLGALGGVEDHEDEVGGLESVSTGNERDSESPGREVRADQISQRITLSGSWPTFAALMTCRPRPLPSEAPSMIPGQIEDLDFCAAIFEHTGNGCEGGEGVCCHFGLGLRDLGEESGFAD